MGHIVILTAPSGAGKTTLAHELLNRLDNARFSVSATTRDPREGEKDGEDYHFLTKKAFKQKIREDKFIEYEILHNGEYYGTLREELKKRSPNDKVILDIDVKGAKNLKEQLAAAVTTIFIKTPTLKVLEDRLRSRGTESEEHIKERLARAEFEFNHAKHFDHILINDDLSRATTELVQIVKENKKPQNNP